MSYKTLTVETSNRVTKVNLNRLEKLNAINREMVQELMRLADELEADEGVFVSKSLSIKANEVR
ncbi:MAG: hypothetical protein FJ005_08390 [Chloroflexi bacterium]|nr:hypothetical protein [Chloroflexota bacterium]